MILYVSTWVRPGSGFRNHVGRDHPLEELRTRSTLFSEEDWVLLWFTEVDGTAFDGYYRWCAEENGGELGVPP